MSRLFVCCGSVCYSKFVRAWKSCLECVLLHELCFIVLLVCLHLYIYQYFMKVNVIKLETLPSVNDGQNHCILSLFNEVTMGHFQKATSQQTVRISDHCFWQQFYSAAMHPGISVQKKMWFSCGKITKYTVKPGHALCSQHVIMNYKNFGCFLIVLS